ncbi:MAG: HAMP domain-containing sensor histidine kinase, partial [Pseudomonadota bacterium]
MARQADATIEAEIKGLGEQYRRRGPNGVAQVIQERITRNPDSSSIYLLINRNRQPIVGNLNAISLTEPVDDQGWVNFELGKEGHEKHLARLRVLKLPNNLILFVGRDIQELKETQQLILRALAWGVAITLGMALVGGIVFSRGMARRIEAINQTSREIMEGDLSRRIPTRGIGDDFDQLAENLNKMLSQIERLMEGVRQVSNNVAHDLKTPLTHLRNRLEGMRLHPPDDEHYQELVEQNINEADRLLSMFNALLRISRIESGSRLTEHTSVDLETLVTDVAELYEAVAHEKEQHFTLHIVPGLTVSGDRDLLFQAIANMLDNAVKYTPPEGHIGVGLTLLPEGVPAIIVQDTGP